MKSSSEAPPEYMASKQSVILPEPTFYGRLETDGDARLLVEGCLRGLKGHMWRDPYLTGSTTQKSAIFVWEK